ncbi:unnamed protein product [Litomosoides sigmodontis]|uniref:Uncharacterized protein n=1 Tax=Litomosoides sigmodontis TaxID=42156 RepID=A0A3P7JKZ9_LITSI|nr:unnamed protein product [Litomosoides sigmodontis]
MSVENRPNIPRSIAVQTTQLCDACFTGIRSGIRHTVTVVPVPVLAKCSNSTYYNDNYKSSIFRAVSSSSTIPPVLRYHLWLGNHTFSVF